MVAMVFLSDKILLLWSKGMSNENEMKWIKNENKKEIRKKMNCKISFWTYFFPIQFYKKFHIEYWDV